MPAAVPDRPPDDAGAPVSLVLRIGAAACFIGHGALGLLRTAQWTSYFAVVGIGPAQAVRLMPWVGGLDIALAIAVLIRPRRGLFLYMAAWAFWTALLRPLAGESAWEAVERAGNFGVPLALFLLVSRGAAAEIGARFRRFVRGRPADRAAWTLRLTTVLLLLGHGALQVIVRKPMFDAQYACIGLHWAGAEPLLGGFECLLAVAVLLKPVPAILIGIVVWKLATEALCPIAGAPLWTFVEHGGSYAAPLGLALLLSAPVASPYALQPDSP